MVKPAKNGLLANFFNSDNVANIKGIRWQNLPYFLIWLIYYAWIVAFSTWWTASPLSENLFGTGVRELLHSLNLLSSAVFVLFIKKEWYIQTARIGAALIVAGMIVYRVTQNAYLQLASSALLGIFFGIVNISILMPFVFVLNNTEKFFAVAGSFALVNLLSLLQENGVLQGSGGIIVSFVTLLLALSMTLFFKSGCIPADLEQTADTPKIKPRAYWTLFFNCLFVILCKGAGKGILNRTAESSCYPLLLWYCIGGLAGCLLFIAIFILVKKIMAILWNIAFACLAVGLFCNAFALETPELVTVFAFLLGVGNTIGMINVYYLLGVIGKKYNSILYVRHSIILIGICGGISGIVVGRVLNNSTSTSPMSIATSFVSVGIITLFLILSPVLSQTKEGDEWTKDINRMEVNNDSAQAFKKYQLSKRETEVCRLLLQGYTLRQISVMLSIAYPTANTYCTSVYRKLNINSRTELLLMFKDEH
ncbi:helix-turn-helix transcriptional regulator [Acetanaerobacterium elongatum]|uniref:Regulatory protein, luxR family n=1 Tax=Acetanaerobacterium elongatum TaxID=258515 RepID=A0A1G9VZE8_9FIRM|nr:helix-turn-helix transcriptional regulator [Acetanaerobacterium elongatum]SDM77620.1 regulatory protein, luxR family [Acetanaerobacterium elongatum]